MDEISNKSSKITLLSWKKGAERTKGVGILKGEIFVGGDSFFLDCLGKETFPFSLGEVFPPVSEGKWRDFFSGEDDSPVFFVLEKGGNRLRVTVFKRIGVPDESIWYIEGLDDEGKPVVGFEQRYHRLFENLKDAVFASTVEGRFVDINPAGVTMLGYETKEEVLSLNILTDLYYYPEDRVKYQKIIARQGYVKDYEVVFKKKDGSPLFVSMSNVAVYDEDRKVLGYEGIFRDLTRQKQIEEELKRKNAQLESYVYTVSHDLKSPIIAIQGFSHLLKKRYGKVLDEKGKGILEKIDEIAKRSEKMIVDLLAYTKAERDAKGDFEFVDTYRVVQSIVDEMRMRWKERPMEVTISPTLPEILFHPGSFRQIMENLIDNAIKYSQQTPVSKVHIDCQIKDDAVVFMVRDNGKGIKPEEQEKIFDIFERGGVTEEIEGTGLGLSIIKRIIETHHGRIWLDSEEGKGTVFYVQLPVRTRKRRTEST